MNPGLTILISLLSGGAVLLALRFIRNRRLDRESSVRQDIEALIETHRGRQPSSPSGGGTADPLPPPPERLTRERAPVELKLEPPPRASKLRRLATIGAASILLAVVAFYALRPPSTSPSQRAARAGNGHGEAPLAAEHTLQLLKMLHRHNGGEVLVEGLVANASSDTLRSITAIAMLYDVHGEFMTTAAGRVLFTALAPREVGPFRIALQDDDRLGSFEVRFRNERGSSLTVRDLRIAPHDYINRPVHHGEARPLGAHHEEVPDSSSRP